MKFLTLIFFLLISPFCEKKQQNVVCEKQDRIILANSFSQLVPQKNLSIAKLVALAGKSLLSKPYVAHTLEKEGKEQLVINFRELDCTTFVENSLAIARSVKYNDASFDSFSRQLCQIRYRNAVINGYTSRLHYFSDWIVENEKKGLVENVSEEIGGTEYPLSVGFMSTHPESYRQLKQNPDFVSIMAEKEKEINRRKMFFLPKNQVEEKEHLLHEGDIIGITTSIKGLDISHVGILMRKKGHIHLMHASSAIHKVVISEETLYTYLQKSKRATGIMIVRPL